MKKTLLFILATVSTCLAYAQQDNPVKSHVTPPIRTERKELKREHYADRAPKSEMRIRRNKHELHHGKNGSQHEWNRSHNIRPVRKGTPNKRRPMMDHKRK